MLLRLLRRRRRGSGDEGAALVGVLAFVLVSLVVTTTIAMSVTSASAQTQNSRAAVQSTAAAEAGVTAARLGLIDGTCTLNAARYEGTTDDGSYVATVWTRLSELAAWTLGCPANTGVAVRILSTGYADTAAINGVTSGQTTNLEVVLSHDEIPPVSDGSGPAIFSYSSAGIGAGASVYVESGEESAIVVQHGPEDGSPYVCSGGAGVGSPGEVHMYLPDSDMTVTAGCSINGNAWVQGDVDFSGGGKIYGDVIADSLDMTGGGTIYGNVWVTGSVTLAGGATIGGNVTAASISVGTGHVNGNVQVSGDASASSGGFGSNVTAANLTFTSSGDVVGSAWVFGTTTFANGSSIGGNLTTATFVNSALGSVGGTKTITGSNPGGSPYATNEPEPAWPTVPTWVDYDFDDHYYNLGSWGTMPIVDLYEENFAGLRCGSTWWSSSYGGAVSAIQLAVDSLGGADGIIDARGCGTTFDLSWGVGQTTALSLNQNLVIITNGFKMGSGSQILSTGKYTLRIITPDPVLDGVPTCTAGQSATRLTGGMTISPTLDIMIYSPCNVTMSGATFSPVDALNGQIFAGETDLGGNGQLNYRAVGIPGLNLDGGGNPGPATTESERVVVSERTVSETNS